MITIAMRKCSHSSPQPYRGLWILTINECDSGFPAPRDAVEARIHRIQIVIARMRSEGQSEAQILGAYGAQ